MMMRSAIVACFVLLVIPGKVAGQSASAAPLGVVDVLDISAFGDRVQLASSADGEWIAVTLQHSVRAAQARDGGYFTERGVPRGHAGSDVYLIEARTGRARRLSDGTGSPRQGVLTSPKVQGEKKPWNM